MIMTSEWVKNIQKIKKKIERLSPKDRLEYTSAIKECLFAIQTSISGWYGWVSFTNIMEHFTEEELSKVLEYFKKYTLELLEYDIKWTKKKQKKVKEKSITYIG